MSEYRYYCLHRPPDLGAVPRDGLCYTESFRAKKCIFSLKLLAWGYAVYNRPLSAEEIEEYELIAAKGCGEE